MAGEYIKVNTKTSAKAAISRYEVRHNKLWFDE
jgi:hypothetical protein